MASLKLMKGRPNWYASIRKADGRRTVINLGVPVKGKRPASLREEGDKAFENSRGRAEQALKSQVASLEDPLAVVTAQKTIMRLQGGEVEKAVKLSELPLLSRELSDGGEAQKEAVKGRTKQFSDFMIERKGRDVLITQVDAKDIQAFYDSREESKSTFRRREGELRRVFREHTPYGVRTPFEAKKKKDRPRMPDSIKADTEQHRTPFTPEELKKIFKEAEGSRIYPLIVLAAGTGLRKGDLCTLEWKSVDLKAGMLRVVPRKTKKHGKEVVIPLSPSVKKVLRKQNAIGKYVFPEIAKLYLSGNTGEQALRRELKEILWRALEKEEASSSAMASADREEEPLKQVSPAEAYMKGIAYVDGLSTTSKRAQRLRDVARLYLLEGKTYREIVLELPVSKSQITEALKAMEQGTGLKMRKDPKPGKKDKVQKLTTKVPPGRRYRQSIRDWHSFRTTWITEALKSGWSVADVQKVTGHAETKIVLENYFRPEEEHLKALPVPASAAV